MARVWSSGFELNSNAIGTEFSASSGSPTVSATYARSGSYGLQTNPSSSSENLGYIFASSNQAGEFYFRFYMNVASLPPVSREAVFSVWSSTFDVAFIELNTNGTLELWNGDDNLQIGSDSSALSTGQWYRIELMIDTTTVASTAIEAKIDGVTFASGTFDLSLSGINRIFIGTNSSDTFDIYYDDLAINDSSGSFQNSWPGEGEIIHLRPNATGDNNEFYGQDLTSDSNNYDHADEVTPDNNTTYLTRFIATLPTTDDYNVDDTPGGLDSSDTINVVQVGVRWNVNSTSGTDAIGHLRIKSTTGGTVEDGTSVTFTSTGWVTNTLANPRNHTLTLYDLPGASTTPWSKSTLDTAQIGFQQENAGTNQLMVSTLWLLVDHKPGVPTVNNTSVAYMTTNTGFWGS